MAPGSRPSSNQRSEKADDSGDGGRRAERRNFSGVLSKRKAETCELTSMPKIGRRSRGSAPASDFCVVCGDRACSHNYGVAACHGCKCFFWRSVKQKQHYVCRFNGNCVINLDHRNTCRYCRFLRCLNAGMQPDSVRMQREHGQDGATVVVSERMTNVIDTTSAVFPAADTNSIGVVLKAPVKLVMSGASNEDFLSLSPQSSLPDPAVQHRSSDEEMVFQIPIFGSEDFVSLTRQLIAADQYSCELADFSENEAPKTVNGVEEIFNFPELLDCYRTCVTYCVRLRKVTAEEMEFCKYRALTKVFDYVQAITRLENGFKMFTVSDKILLLRYAFAPLTLFEIASGTVRATRDSNLLCLPTGITVSHNEEIVSNGFISQKLLTQIVDSLNRIIYDLSLDDEETAIFKAIVVLNCDVGGYTTGVAPFSVDAERFMHDLKDRVHGALYQHCVERECRATNGSGGEDARKAVKSQAITVGHVSSTTPLVTSCAEMAAACGHRQQYSNAQRPRNAALRFAKLLHVLPKLTLLARDLVEHIQISHTFQTVAIDSIFFQLFGDIFQEERNNDGAIAAASASSQLLQPVTPADNVKNKALISLSLTSAASGGGVLAPTRRGLLERS